MPNEKHIEPSRNESRTERLPEIELTINQRPIDVEFACPKCGEHHRIDYQEFIATYGQPADWSEITCPNCGSKLCVDDTTWD